MQLKFVAKDDQMVMVPGTAQFAGQIARFVNRECVVGKDETVSWPALAEPHEVDSDSKDGSRLAKIARRDGALLPYDKQTADAIGVPFVALKFTAGVWAPVPAKEGKA
jgi:hypothetical protein